MANEKTEQKNAFGLTAEEQEKASKMVETFPTFETGNMAVGDFVDFESVSAAPEMVRHKQMNKETKKEEEVETPIIRVKLIESGEIFTLWLSAKSLKMHMAKLSSVNDDNLEGVRFRLKKETYEHQTQGKTIGYRVTQLPPQEMTSE